MTHRIPVEDTLDLHAFAPRDVASVVSEFVTEAHTRGFHEVRLIGATIAVLTESHQ
jgi:DNA-nicking Smr family endonuclease